MDKYCNVKNRSASVVVYRIPEDGIRRSFAPGETKKISFEELEKLTYQSGGLNILTRFLQVQSDEAIKTFNMKVEPEYYMSEADVAKMITSGSLDAFIDTLNFAPTGVIDLIKKLSISIPLTDIDFSTLNRNMSPEDIKKVIAFQIGQSIGLMDGYEYYTKSEIADAYPILRQFLYRDPESNINELDAMLKYFIKRIYDEVNTHIIYEDGGIISFLTFEDDGIVTYSKYYVKNEKRIC